MKTRILLICCITLVGTQGLRAAVPDIVWKTNAHAVEFVRCVAFARDGQILASGGDDLHAKIWQASDGMHLQTVGVPDGSVLGVDFSPDGTILATVGDSEKMRLWNVGSGQLIRSEGAPEIVNAVQFTPDGQFVVLGSIDGLVQKRRTDGALIMFYSEVQAYSISLSTNGDHVLAGSRNGNAYLLSTTNHPMEIIQQFTGHDGEVYSVAFSPDNTLVGTGAFDGARLWRASDGTNLFVLNSGLFTRAVRFSRDGKLFLTGGDSGIRIWRASDGQLLEHYTVETSGVYCLDVSPDNKLFAYGRADGVLVVARMPLVMEQARVEGGQLVLRWQGGSGLYQLQTSTNLTGGGWQNVADSSSATGTTNALAGTLFYRVQSLPNP